jgi:ribokinase
MSIIIAGSFVQDYVWQVPELPKLGESRIGSFLTGPGGKGFNQALCVHRQGAAVKFLGALGKDVAGAGAKQLAIEQGLPCSWLETTEPTAAASVIVAKDGSNFISVALGANLKLSATHIQAHAAEIANARLVLTQLETDLSASVALLELAKRANVLCMLNPAPINTQATVAMLALADVLTPNETEFAFLLQHLHDKKLPHQWWQQADDILHAYCRILSANTVVITLGKDGAFVSHGANQRGDAQAFYRAPALKANAVDTTGAGDAFNAGLASALDLHSDKPFEFAVQNATRVAATSVESVGAALAMPTAAQVQARFPL